MKTAHSKANCTSDGEQTYCLASGKPLSRADCGVGLLTEVREVACLGVFLI